MCSSQAIYRPFYSASEVEKICSDALVSSGLMPSLPGAIRIERFVEKYFKVDPRYEVLPHNILGYTEFGADGVRAVVITSSLDEEGGRVAERRIRTTLADEAGHGLLHAHLFTGGSKPSSLFADDNDRPEILCRDVQGEQQATGRVGQWWELQANLAIGSLLMPRSLVSRASEPFCTAGGLLGLPIFREDQRGAAIRQLAELFDVNPMVARIRLNAIFPPSLSGQFSL